jgi:hypothetical protein
MAEDLLAFARQEALEGYKSDDPIRIRDAAEKAWNAVLHATDLGMRSRGHMPTPGPQAHTDRHRFLEKIGRHDLQMQLAFFSDRLHGSCFYEGAIPEERIMTVWLDKVQQYIEDIKAGI